MKKLIWLFVFCLSLLAGRTPILAEEVDMNQRGSLTITVHDAKGTPIPGGTITIYHIGTIENTSSQPAWKATPEFAKANADLSQPENRQVIAYLADYASRNEIPGRTYTIPANATVKFSDIPLGLYLVVQQKAAPGYRRMNSFLISVPNSDENGHYVYDVNAYPKADPSNLPPDADQNCPPVCCTPCNTCCQPGCSSSSSCNASSNASCNIPNQSNNGSSNTSNGSTGQRELPDTNYGTNGNQNTVSKETITNTSNTSNTSTEKVITDTSHPASGIATVPSRTSSDSHLSFYLLLAGAAAGILMVMLVCRRKLKQ